MEFKIRELNNNDWDMLNGWWDAWPKWQSPPKDILPENGNGGLVVEKDGTSIVAGFVYLTNSKTALLEWIISNPKYRDNDREDAIRHLIKSSEDIVKAMGFKYMFTMLQHKGLIETHRDLGWHVDKKPSHELIKTL